MVSLWVFLPLFAEDDLEEGEECSADGEDESSQEEDEIEIERCRGLEGSGLARIRLQAKVGWDRRVDVGVQMGRAVQAISYSNWHPEHDDRPFIVLTETKFSFRCIPVGIGTLLTGLGSTKKTHVIMFSP